MAATDGDTTMNDRARLIELFRQHALKFGDLLWPPAFAIACREGPRPLPLATSPFTAC